MKKRRKRYRESFRFLNFELLVIGQKYLYINKESNRKECTNVGSCIEERQKQAEDTWHRSKRKTKKNSPYPRSRSRSRSLLLPTQSLHIKMLPLPQNIPKAKAKLTTPHITTKLPDLTPPL